MITGNASLVYRDIISEVLKNRAVRPPERYIFPRAGVLAAMAEKNAGQKF